MSFFVVYFGPRCLLMRRRTLCLRWSHVSYTIILLLTNNSTYFDALDIAEENEMVGAPVAYLQNALHTEHVSLRHCHRHRN